MIGQHTAVETCTDLAYTGGVSDAGLPAQAALAWQCDAVRRQRADAADDLLSIGAETLKAATEGLADALSAGGAAAGLPWLGWARGLAINLCFIHLI